MGLGIYPGQSPDTPLSGRVSAGSSG